jgi:tetratricopeptide (TPR) repeat protein
VRLAPSSDLAWYNRGLVRRDLGECRAALGDFDRALALQPQFFNALYQRANCRQALGQYAEAIDDYSQAVAFPGRIPARFLAHLGRADALRRLGRLDEAYGDYTRVAELRDDTRALRSRAWVQYYRGRWREAQEDAARYLLQSEAKEHDAPYALILGALALRRAGDDDGASRFLREWQPRLAAKAWPAPVLLYLADGNEKRLLAAAKDAGQRTEARAYVGANLLARGERSRAVDILSKVLREDEPGYLEYDLAYYELERLGAARPADRRTLKR